MSPTRVASPPAHPLMVWDGECRFCGAWIRRWQTMTGDQIVYETSQSVGTRFPELTTADYANAVFLLLPDGRVLRGAEAVFGALAFNPRRAWPQKLYRQSPAFARVCETAYAFVARNRMFFSKLTRLFWGEPAPSTYRFSGMLFTRLLGLTFLVAFLSFWTQAAGLVGSHGIFPLAEYFNQIDLEVANHPDAPNWFWQAPSLLWLAPNDTGLQVLLAAGSLCAFLAMAGLVPGWALLGCVITYSSLRNGVPIFLGFQWDALIVEAGVVGLFVAPWSWWQKPFALREPPAVGRWLAWWLLFKLMFLSGLVKILTNASPAGPEHPGWVRQFFAALTGVPIGENQWLDGTALQYHFFTQPLAAPTSWWFAHWPPGLLAATLWFTMFVEIIVPFAFFGPRRLRHLAALLQVFLQLAIAFSGNYGFFNLLTLALCVPLFDDAFWPERVQKLLRRSMAPPAISKIAPRWLRLGAWVRGTVAGLMVFIGLIQIGEAWERRSREPGAPPPGDADGHIAKQFHALSEDAQRLGLVNSYGLFRVMTTERPELIIEGSDDGTTWKPYEFVWKPGDVNRIPAYANPHMPRLDWQMWFAALQLYYEHSYPPWLPRFLAQIAQNNPVVLSLLANNPFPQKPPANLRIRLALYRFTTPQEHATTGDWWVATPKPEFTLTAHKQ